MTNLIPEEKNTPLMEQYFTVKAHYPDTLVFFQVGDFYELFFDDAKTVAAYLAITLTKRGKNKGEDVPLCGVPVHALTHYLVKLVKGGFKVAVCDQLSKPVPGTVVQRGVTRVFTPGTLIDTNMLDEKSASYLLSFFPQEDGWGLIFAELLTAQLFATIVPSRDYRMIDAELTRFFPDEILLPKDNVTQDIGTYYKQQGYYVTPVSCDQEYMPVAKAWIEEQFNESMRARLDSFPALQASVVQLYFYLKRHQERALDSFKSIQFYEPEDYVILDSSTQKNLEIISNSYDGGRKNTLLSVLDGAKTAMGSRAIKKWLQRPLVQKASIIQRQEFVSLLVANHEVRSRLGLLLQQCADLERIVGRIALGRASVHDYLALRDTLVIIPEIKKIFNEYIQIPLGRLLLDRYSDLSNLQLFLQASVHDDATQGWIIKPGFDYQLDRVRNLVVNGQQEIMALEQREIAETGIASLKISYNQVTGYYIEVTIPNLSKVPERYQHQQTLANRTRFVTPELKILEAELFKAQQEIDSIEKDVFERVKQEVAAHLGLLRQIALALAYTDGLFGFAQAAVDGNFVVPVFNDDHNIIIRAGRHPVISQLNPRFIPNDTQLTNEESLWIITGPNMGGKSTYLRQVALLCIMAQCGSLVSAQSANLPLLDRVFTRIGSGDNLAQGKSTFLIEMEEAATICAQATRNSFVILDEVGRGTSTFDGIALAQAIVEHIVYKIQARCLFATHYYELTTLAGTCKKIATYHMACKKTDHAILFLYTIIKGVARGSFGLDVARLAALPDDIVMRAREILQQLVASPHEHMLHKQEQVSEPSAHERAVLAQLRALNGDELTPRQALETIWRLKSLLH